MSNTSILVVTSDQIANYEIVETIGEVFGITVQSRDAVSDFGASIKNIFGGEIKSYTQMLENARAEAIYRLQEAAVEKGSDAVIAMRFDSNEISETASSVVAYGTAVKIRHI